MAITLYQVRYENTDAQAKQWEELNLILRMLHNQMTTLSAEIRNTQEAIARQKIETE